MTALKRILSNWWVLTIAAAVVVALLLALGLPILAAFARPWWVRLLLVVLVAAVWGGCAAWRLAKGKKASDRMADELAKPPPAGDAEAALLGDRMKSAVATLKKASGEKRDYLYSRPWYVIIGPPGAGKTTALVNSGLRFPFSDAALKGVGGTRNLDFWFADQAVLVDTAGRYTTQDSNAATDSKGWESFLSLLRRNRPLQPINGVLVAIGLDELLRADRQTLDAHAAAVRRRLQELQTTLEVAAPVYVLFTKADLLAGFSEYFEDLDVEGRRAVLGATLPWPSQGLGTETIAREYDTLVRSISERSATRLQNDLDMRRRALVLGFPAQWAPLRSRVVRFLEGAFLSDEGARAPLRGFYFTSGVQEGAPLDRILGGVAAVYDAPQPAARAGQGGRAYFLNRLLNDVVFAEAGLVQSDPKAKARRTAQLIGGLAAIAAVALLILVLMTVSFFGNRNLQTRLLASANGVQQAERASGIDLVEVRETDPDLEQSLSVLRALRDLPRGYAERHKGGPPLTMRVGLFQGAHSTKAEQAYLEALQRIMLPRILLRLERYLQEHQQQPLQIYEPLKAYLMLGGQGPLDRKAVKAWVVADWAQNVLPGGDRAQTRKELGEHLDALLADPQLGRVWPSRTAPLDGAAIASSRSAIQTLSLADRAYAVLKQKASEADGPAWRADAVLASGDARAFGNGEQVLGLTVPYFFTRAGFDKAYQLGLQTVNQSLENDLWVLGPDADKAAIRTQLQGVRPGVAAAYARDYSAAWEAVASAPQPANYFGDPVAFGALTRTPSPLKLLLLEVRKNTTFGGGAGAAAAAKLGALAGAAAAVTGSGSVDAAREIESRFRPINDYVGDGKAPAPIDEFISAIKAAGSANAAAGVAGGGMGGAAAQGQLATATGQVAMASAGAPPLLQGFMSQAAKGGQTAAVSSARGALGEEYERQLAPACRAVVEDRYPFYGASQNDAAVADMLRVFGLNGQVDSFARDRLAPLLETAAPIWLWRMGDPVASALDPTSAAQLQKAQQIRDMLASGVPIRVALDGFGGGVTAAEFSAGGASVRFEAAAAGERPVMWSVSSLPEAHVTLYAGQQVVKQFSFQGPWALFRLFDAAKKENAGPTSFKATFGEGAAFATFRVGLPSEKNPFSRGGAWSFRCPAKL